MGSLLTWLDAYPSMLEPTVATLLVVTTLALVVLFVLRPASFVPVVLITTPIPKLYSIGVRADVTFTGSDYSLTRIPGASLIDLVILAGLIAVLITAVLGRDGARPKSASVDRWLVACVCAVFGSLLLNMMLGTPGVDLAAWLYAVRYSAAILCFFLAKRSLSRAETSVGSLLKVCRLSGNVYIVLGLIFYFFGGGRAWVDPEFRSLTHSAADASGLFRTPMFFFDYGYDFGLYAVFVVMLNILALFQARSLFAKLANGAFAVLAVLGVMLIAERGNYVALISAVGALPVMLARARRRGGVGAVAKSLSVTVAVGAVSVLLFFAIAPPSISGKIQNSMGAAANSTDAVMLAQDLGLSDMTSSALLAIPLGDFGGRLMYMAASLREAFSRPWGVGFWCEITAVGWYAHNDLVKILVEMGLVGLFVFLGMMRSLWRELAKHASSKDPEYVSTVAMLQAFLFGLGVTMLFGTSVIVTLKVSVFIWCLIGAVLSTGPSGAQLLPASPRRPVTRVLVRDASLVRR